MKDYANQREHHELYLIRFFVNSLRPEIIDEMPKIKFDKLEECIKIAIEAEEQVTRRKLIHSNKAQVIILSGSIRCKILDQRDSYHARSKSLDREPNKMRVTIAINADTGNECPQ